MASLDGGLLLATRSVNGLGDLIVATVYKIILNDTILTVGILFLPFWYIVL